MLEIVITGYTPTNDLIFKVDGRPNNGHSSACRTESVHWRVNSTSGVDHIMAITMKPIAGTTDIFSANPPTAQNPTQKFWKGIVNSNAQDFSVYVYKIEWVKEHETTPRTFDPIISIKPTDVAYKILIIPVVTFVLGLLGISLFLRKKKKSK